MPTPTHGDPNSLSPLDRGTAWVPARQVFESLPDPLREPRDGQDVQDPNYPLHVSEHELTDHFGAVCLTDTEADANRRMKADHSFYGKMSFPDLLDRPARTVMATQLRTSRETFVLQVKDGDHPLYRVPTVRECASLQSFPITYQFVGATPETRYKLVGNAVPPLLAGGVARAILRAEGLPVPRPLRLAREIPLLTAHLPVPRATRPTAKGRLPVDRKFRDHLAGSRENGFRVDLDNVEPTKTKGEGSPLVRWSARLWVGSGKHLLSVTPTLEQTVHQFARVCATPEERRRAEKFIGVLGKALGDSPPTGEMLQAVWSGRRRGLSPTTLLRRLSEAVEAWFPPIAYSRRKVPVHQAFPDIEREELPARAAAFLFAGRFAVALLEREFSTSREAVEATLKWLDAPPRNLAFLSPSPA